VKSTAGELARLMGGEVEVGASGAPFEGGVSIDSRTIGPRELFFAIIGPRHDGHAFVADAMKRGAAGVVASKRVEVAPPAFLIRVPDTTRALQDLARGVREKQAMRVVGITGSMGKTTTKEAAARAIGCAKRVLKTEGNLNNDYGLPLTLLRVSDEEVAVLEMGMSAAGEIARLTEIAKPDVGVLTNVAEVHLEFFESLSAIARAKGELFEGLRPEAVAVVNADDPLVLEQARRFAGRKIRFGVEGSADIRASEIRGTSSGLRFVVERGGETFEVETALRGRHNVYNLLAGLAAASALDVPFGAAASALAGLEPARHRGERLEFDGGFLVIDETYNSNPRALKAAIDSLAEEEAGRRIAVVGGMLELGERSEEMHRDAGRHAARRNLDRLVGVGDLGRLIVEGAREGGLSAERLLIVAGAAEAGELLRGELRAGDVVLLKASRGVALERAIEALRLSPREAMD
jgi:UDP-N-acetylmuramoyl-tripeptide--D-alanyl-D-alanine ligase